MEKYRGFFIRLSSYQSERKEWCGGHSSEGIGIYDTIESAYIVDTETGKEADGGTSSLEAKKTIDIHLDCQSEIEQQENRIKALGLSIAQLKQEKLNYLRQIDRKIVDLEEQERQEYNSDFRRLRFY